MPLLTPRNFFRIPVALEADDAPPASDFSLPPALIERQVPPKVGDGWTLAAYDEQDRTGMLRWIGVITGVSGAIRIVEWRPTSAEIGVTTSIGHQFWKKGAFRFADTKPAHYGFHELWQEHFEAYSDCLNAGVRRRVL